MLPQHHGLQYELQQEVVAVAGPQARAIGARQSVEWALGTPRPLEATSWAEVPLALQIQNPEGRTVLLRLTLKRRKLPHPSFDPMSELPIYRRVTGPEANHCLWSYCGSRRTNRTFGWYGTNQYGAFLRICNTTPKIRLRLPHTDNEEVLQDGYRLVLLPKLAYYAM